MDDLQGAIFRLLLFIPAFVSALTVHEFAHAWAGHRLGDDTAERQGRLTLDPMAHLDPFGSIMIVFAVLYRLPLMGWARPVPFNPRNLKDPRRGGMLIALAGPISNLMQMPIWLGLLWLCGLLAGGNRADFALGVLQGLTGHPDIANPLSLIGTMLATGVLVNLGLAAFNMIPLPPLDGHYVLEALGPPYVTDLFNSIRPFSFLILYALLLTGIINQILGPVQMLSYRLVFSALGTPIF
ncbi:MAG TPA: site-2 protease family protein [Abditibacteriaceae bacterium]|jgi:Zn-dependent protease